MAGKGACQPFLFRLTTSREAVMGQDKVIGVRNGGYVPIASQRERSWEYITEATPPTLRNAHPCTVI